jgi:uncharacterized membrane protein (UPF0182 family)
VLVAVVVVVLLLAQFWTEVMWFQAIDFSRVIWTQWITRAVLFAIGFVVMATAVWVSFRVAYRALHSVRVLHVLTP